MKIIRWIVVIIFLIEGATKLLGVGFQVEAFEKWGYPLWFMYAIGILELAGAVGISMRQARMDANVGLIGIMIGAFYTHISRGDPLQMMGLAVIALVLLLIHLRSLGNRQSKKP